MTARKIKHARALQRREEFLQNVREANYNVLAKVRSQREEEQKKAQEELKKKKIDKSKRLAQNSRQKNGVDINAEYANDRRRQEAIKKAAPKKKEN